MKKINGINNSPPGKFRVLVAPLDWGLGHATRCIPLINELLITGCEVVIAAEGSQRRLLQLEFPNLECLELRGYRLKYSKKGWQLPLALFLQIPKILISIKRENRWLRQLQQQSAFHAIISDNRYGLHCAGLNSIFITHQLCIQTNSIKIIDSIIQKINYHFINLFDECWVPDFEGVQNLAGKLSHPKKFPSTPLRYLGSLSRFQQIPCKAKQIDLLVIISGPEPQRSIFETIVLKELANTNGRIVLVRGLPESKNEMVSRGNVEIHDHLSAFELNNLVACAGYILSRPGYSTVMDLIKLGSKAIFVPTPGQTEQEYLAEYLSGMKIAVMARQDNFSLQQSLEQASSFPFVKFEPGEAKLPELAVGALKSRIAEKFSADQSSAVSDFG